MTMNELLEVRNLSVHFGGIAALSKVNFAVRESEILGLIGPNGSGKTTCLNVLSGIYTPSEGSVIFEGQDITGLPPHRVAMRGIARTFQNLRIYRNVSCLDNVLVGRHRLLKQNALSVFLLPLAYLREERVAREKAMELLNLVGLASKAHEEAQNLAYGEQRRLEIARALATEPTLLLLDEPKAGMNPTEGQDLVALIRRIRDMGKTILLIEHNMQMIMSISDRIVVLNQGEKLIEGAPAEVQRSEQVQEVYLGREEAA
jgi:branched-chain amino acid transport system ATP-binding protein